MDGVTELMLHRAWNEYTRASTSAPSPQGFEDWIGEKRPELADAISDVEPQGLRRFLALRCNEHRHAAA